MHSFTEKKRIRKNFGRHQNLIKMPSLLGIQTESFRKFIIGYEDEPSGIEEAFLSVFPIFSIKNDLMVEFVNYRIVKPAFNAAECRKRGRTYSVPLFVTFRATCYDLSGKDKVISFVSTEEVFMGDIPMMTKAASFIIKGIEKVVISQIHKSPGIFFVNNSKDVDTDTNTMSASIIPYFGSWLDIDLSSKNIMYCRIDKKKRIPLAVFLMAMGLSKYSIYEKFYPKFTLKRKGNRLLMRINDPQDLVGKSFNFALLDKDDGECLVKANVKIKRRDAESILNVGCVQINEYALPRFVPASSIGRFEALSRFGDIAVASIPEDEAFLAFYVDMSDSSLCNSFDLKKDIDSEEAALLYIYKLMRSGEPPSYTTTKRYFDNLFFTEDTYNLSEAGRMKLNNRLGITESTGSSVLQEDDIIQTIQVMLNIRNGKDHFDDIDNMGNRRIRSVGETLKNYLRYSLLAIERQIRDQTTYDEGVSITALLGNKQATVAIKTFFNSSQLSQFMDQINPLSEVTHKRRISALGEGGISRKSAGFEIRDVHVTQYGRLCPIETPEGSNIGLINSLAMFARLNRYGFIETAYAKVIGGKVTDNIEYMNVTQEQDKCIAQVDDCVGGKLKEGPINCRNNNEVLMFDRDMVNYVDVSAQQTVSVAAALVPFLEHNDANRALMGSNMQRQAVPLLFPEKPLVGTGIERTIAKGSGATIVAEHGGVVTYADGEKIVVSVHEDEICENECTVDVYHTDKYIRSNQGTCINQRVLVKEGDEIQHGDIIADGCSTDLGELSLGKNVLVAFMPLNGYNFEDSIFISDRVVQEDTFTSIHIEELVCTSRSIPNIGDEEITCDIPNVSLSSLAKLDNCGIVPVGSVVRGGDILVGKVTPKGDSPVTPEERLLYSLFGDKANNVTDTSLRLPLNKEGVVIDVTIFDSNSEDRDERSQAFIDDAFATVKRDIMLNYEALRDRIFNQVDTVLKGKRLAASFHTLKKNSVLTTSVLKTIKPFDKFKLHLTSVEAGTKLSELQDRLVELRSSTKDQIELEKKKINTKDILPKGALKIVKVYVAVKRCIQPGDKLAGRHGNKGCISAVMPVEDMPYMKDGTPIDIVLNPLGVPSRMNIGQILETQLGFAAKGLGKQIGNILDSKKAYNAKLNELRDFLHEVYNEDSIEKVDFDTMEDTDVLELGENLREGVPVASPVFDGAKEAEIRRLLQLAYHDDNPSGQYMLFDGRTGEQFDRPVTVGYMYMLKLNHLVDEKMHARSTGPYSMVTQQPLGGKSQQGGQRLGEMEVWALESYGAAHTLREMMTIKSDDIPGRYDTYKTIIEGNMDFQMSRPESFNVLLKELMSLGFNVQLYDS